MTTQSLKPVSRKAKETKRLISRAWDWIGVGILLFAVVKVIWWLFF